MPLLTPEIVPGLLSAGGSARRDVDVAANFVVGEVVEALNINPTTHTRLPRYIRGKKGVIDRDHGVFEFPDSVAHYLGEKPQHVYSVRFAFQELWGDDYPANQFLYIDLFDDYLKVNT